MSTSRGSNADTPSTPAAADLSGALLSEDLPPAYTAVADSRHGETSVEFGPHRPFQQAPPPLQQPRAPIVASPWAAAPRPATSGWQSAWSGYPGSLHRSATGGSSASHRPPPPPRHPSRANDDLFPSFSGSSSRSTVHAPPPPPPVPAQATTDFARDFYSAGGDDTALLGGRSNQYAPPPGAPSSPSGVPDDGRPTERPVPGHPLLNGGRVLVYPAGYECHKCQNTGYKHYDPSHPCSRCWKKFSKPFSGPIAYAPWGSSSADHNQSNLNLQRPLRLLPSPTSHHRYTSSLTNLSPNPYLSRSATTITRRPSASLSSLHTPGTTDAQSNWIPFPGGGGGFPPPSSPSMYASGPQYVQTHGPPPPGAVVVRPGDARLGGRVCWRCDGSGTVSVFFLLDERCDVCNGLGRVFN